VGDSITAILDLDFYLSKFPVLLVIGRRVIEQVIVLRSFGGLLKQRNRILRAIFIAACALGHLHKGAENSKSFC